MKRRAILRLLPAVPFVGQKAVAEAANASVGMIAPFIPDDRGKDLGFIQFFDFISYWNAVKPMVEKQAQHITVIDPDIAAMRSWSLTKKYQVQRRRYVEKAKKEARATFLRTFDRFGMLQLHETSIL